jgi:hypothetical protein
LLDAVDRFPRQAEQPGPRNDQRSAAGTTQVFDGTRMQYLSKGESPGNGCAGTSAPNGSASLVQLMFPARALCDLL